MNDKEKEGRSLQYIKIKITIGILCTEASVNQSEQMRSTTIRPDLTGDIFVISW